MKKITITPAQRVRLLQTGRVTILRPIYKGPTVEQLAIAGIDGDFLPLVIGCEWYPSMIVERGVQVVGPDVYGFLHPTDKTNGWKCPFIPGQEVTVREAWNEGPAVIETITVKLARTRYVWEIGLKRADL